MAKNHRERKKTPKALKTMLVVIRHRGVITWHEISLQQTLRQRTRIRY